MTVGAQLCMNVYTKHRYAQAKRHKDIVPLLNFLKVHFSLFKIDSKFNQISPYNFGQRNSLWI